MRYLPRRDFCFLCRYSCRAFRVVHRPADAELRGKFRTGNICVRVGLTGGARFLQFFPQGRGATEHAGSGSGTDRYVDGRIGQLRTEHIAAGHGRHPLRRHNQHAGAGRGATDLEADGTGVQYSGFGLCGSLSAGGGGSDSCRTDNTQGIGP